MVAIKSKERVEEKFKKSNFLCETKKFGSKNNQPSIQTFFVSQVLLIIPNGRSFVKLRPKRFSLPRQITLGRHYERNLFSFFSLIKAYFHELFFFCLRTPCPKTDSRRCFDSNTSNRVIPTSCLQGPEHRSRNNTANTEG